MKARNGWDGFKYLSKRLSFAINGAQILCVHSMYDTKSCGGSMPISENFQRLVRTSERVSVTKDAELLTENGFIKIGVGSISNTGAKNHI